MPVKRNSVRKRKSSRDHKCIWIPTDHQFRSSSRCKICRRQRSRKNGYYRYH